MVTWREVANGWCITRLRLPKQCVFPSYGSALRLCEIHAQSIAALTGQKTEADNDAAPPTGLTGPEECIAWEAFGFPWELLYPTPWKINVLSNGLVNRCRIVKSMFTDTALKILSYPTWREWCLTLPIAWGICRGMYLRGVASSDATISVHLSGGRRTASVIRRQESPLRREVEQCQLWCHPVGSATGTDGVTQPLCGCRQGPMGQKLKQATGWVTWWLPCFVLGADKRIPGLPRGSLLPPLSAFQPRSGSASPWDICTGYFSCFP